MARKVLVVDDNPVIIKLVSELLKKADYQVRTASDGLAALNILEEYQPDIIFIDLVLPKISGEMLCQVIRSKERFKDAYLVVLSGIAAESGLDLGKLGVDTCIAKGQKIAHHIQEVLRDIEAGTLHDKSFKIHGLKDVFVRQVTMELLDSKKHLEVILANVNDGLLEITGQGAIIYANPAAESLLAAHQDQLLGADFFSFFKGADQQYARDLLAAARAPVNSAPSRVDLPLSLHRRFVTLRFLSLEDGPNQPCIAIMTDITAAKIAHETLEMSEGHYRELIENTTDLVQKITPDGSFLYVNRAWKENLGYSDEEINVLNIQDILAPQHRERCLNFFSFVLEGESIDQVETAFIAKDGRTLEVIGNVSCRMEGGKPAYTRGIFHNISERKLLEKKLQNSLADFESIFDNSLVGIFHVGIDGKILRCNRRLAEMAGYEQEELVGTDGRFLYLSDEHYQTLLDKLPGILAGEEIRHLEFPFKRKDGSLTWSLLSARVVDPNDPTRGVVGISDDITARKELEEQLKRLSTTDQLTGAYNRRGFEDFFSREVSRAKRYNEPLALVIFDIDHFKLVNDLHGHDAGDQVLRQLVDIGRKQIREIDSLFRWGGEEFLLLLPRTPIDAAQLVVERLRQKVATSDFSLPSPITISIGVSMYHLGDRAEELIKRADMALYEAKDGGRNRVVVSP